MPSTPTIFSPVTLSKAWIDVFEDLDQWDEVDRFYAIHARELNTVKGHQRLCSPKVGYLLALRAGTVQLVHHITQEIGDDLQGEDDSEIWALTGAGGTASTIVIGSRNLYEQNPGEPCDWTTMAKWKRNSDVTTSTDKAHEKRTKTASKPSAAAKKNAKATGRPRRSTAAMTPKMKEYKKTMTTDSGESDDDEVELVNDENEDPVGNGGATGVIVPNVLPIPAFLVVALMKAYCMDAPSLCIAAIEAIKERAIRAGEEPIRSEKAKIASYVAVWLWNAARDRRERPNGVRIGPVANPRADEWARDCHLRHLAERVAVPRNLASTRAEPNSEVWTNLANALALQATDRAGASAPGKKKQGFEAFPVTTRRLILVASEREEDGQMRLVPVETYVEILELGNAAHVRDHLHHHLHEDLGLDVWLPTGLCSAVRMASFLSVLRDRPEAFSLFSCGPQPLGAANIATTDDESAAPDDFMRMQLKITDSTTGLSDKDVKKLTVVKHTIPNDFVELARLLENFAGVTELVFGSASPISSMLRGWVHFLTKAGGNLVSNLRHLAYADATAPSRLGWFIDRRLQQFLSACARCDHADRVDLDLFDFRQARQQLRDGAFVYPLCPYLKSKLSKGGDSKPAARGGRTSGSGYDRRGYADDVVENPQGKAKLNSKDHWQTFIDHAFEAPIPGMCCRYHLNGRCRRGCPHSDTHNDLTAGEKAALPGWIAKCRSRMPASGNVKDAKDGKDSKKPKPLGHNDTAYLSTPTLTVAARPARTSVPLRSDSSRTATRSFITADEPSAPPADVGYSRLTASATTTRPVDDGYSRLATAKRPRPVDDGRSRLAVDKRPRPASPTGDTLGTLTVPVTPPFPTSPVVPATPRLPPVPVSPPPQCKFVPVPRLLSPADRFPCLPVGRLPAALHALLHAPPVPTHPVDFRFEWTDAAAAHNLRVLRRFNLDLAAAIAAQPFSAVTPGSEFRPAAQLAPFLSRHPLWPRFQERITLGAQFPLQPIDDGDRLTDLTATLSRGNHKSARGHERQLLEMLKDEVSRGWQLPLPKEAALELPGCEAAPLGVVSQWTIGADGSRQPKLRLTHDQSFNASRGEQRSVNDRVIKEDLTPARFGRALLRLLHYICLLRRRHPSERLLLTKVDCKSAYRRIHLMAETALKACTVIAGILLVALRLTFGGAPNPSQWSDVSEVAVDLANDLVRREDWDPEVWWAPQQHLLGSGDAVDCDAGKIEHDDDFGEAFEMSVQFPIEDDLPIFDCYLDDLFGVGREKDRDRLEAVVPLVLHLIGRPVEEGVEESVPRDALLAVSKFLAEAKASETKVILGWEVNTRRMTVSLPADKHRAWTGDLLDIRSRAGRRVTAKELESTIGRLSHAAYVVPNSRHFLGRLYRASERASAHGSVKLNPAQWDDLGLWLAFLDAAHRGVSINRLVARWPTRIVRVDACPQGIGGYGLQSGIAWRLQLDADLVGRGSLNSLEFLAALVGVWVETKFGPGFEANDVLLCQGDSSSAAGWLSKSSFGDECPLKLAIARSMAKFLNEHSIPHYSQWFPGKENSVADVLSRDFHLSDDAVISLLRQQFSNQLPQSFRLVHLTTAMISDVGELLRLLPKTQQLPLAPVPSAAAAGASSRGSSIQSDTTTTLSWRDSESLNESKFSPASRRHCEKDGRTTPPDLRDLALDDRRAQFVPPSTVWRRPFGLTNLSVQSTTTEDDLTPFWPRS
jgi:hypothetical protein